MRLSWQLQRLRLRSPLQISRTVVEEKETIVLHLEHEGLTGYGEAVATTYYRQSLADIQAALQALATDLDGLDDPFDLQSALDDLLERYPTQTFTLAALDSALYDWLGKRLGLPLYALLGLDRRRLKATAYTVGIDTPEEVERQVRAVAARGFTTIKLKLGLPTLAAERAIVAAARRAVPEAALWLDPNAAWPPDEAAERISALADFRPELIEQPIAPGQIGQLERLSARSPVPIIADEDAVRLEDVPRLARAVAGINVKLVKCGGVRQGLRLIHAARASGLTVMLGCMTVSSLGIAPSVHLAPLVEYVDLDGHLDLVCDPWDGVGGEDGRLRLGTRPGLGLEPRASARADHD